MLHNCIQFVSASCELAVHLQMVEVLSMWANNRCGSFLLMYMYSTNLIGKV